MLETALAYLIYFIIFLVIAGIAYFCLVVYIAHKDPGIQLMEQSMAMLRYDFGLTMRDMEVKNLSRNRAARQKRYEKYIQELKKYQEQNKK